MWLYFVECFCVPLSNRVRVMIRCSVWLVVVHTYLCYFRLSLSHSPGIPVSGPHLQIQARLGMYLTCTELRVLVFSSAITKFGHSMSASQHHVCQKQCCVVGRLCRSRLLQPGDVYTSHVSESKVCRLHAYNHLPRPLVMLLVVLSVYGCCMVLHLQCNSDKRKVVKAMKRHCLVWISLDT